MERPPNGGVAVKHDSEKVPLGLLPWVPLAEIGKVLQFGARKYAAHNWRAGFQWSRPYSAILRHLAAWSEGENLDSETGLNHVAHAACEALFLLQMVLERPDLDDRYNGAGTRAKPSLRYTPPPIPVLPAEDSGGGKL